jgi:hypothetical protein
VRSSLKTRGAWLVVGAAVAWNFLNLRAETLGVSYLDDSSMHEQMVRFATEQFRSGNLPLTSWFPDLGLGSPQFLHYQSLAAMVTGVVGLILGPDAAFRWSLYILLSLWPASVYLCARLFGVERWGAAASAAMSPFLMSMTGVGYEQHAYVWKGFGVWTQLWASMTLPLAWGLSWRAIRDGRGFCPAVALVSLTTMLHFETGYLALFPLLLWPFVSRDSLIAGVRRASVVLGGSLLAAAWVIVPLIAQRPWAATNEILHGTGLVNGYGAGRVLGWLVCGQLLDHGRFPVVTLFAAIGLALACARCRKDANARALLVVLAVCLLLSFGRATFGALVDVIPGAGDIFFRRFMMGIQVAALVLGGGGAAWCARTTWNALKRATASRDLGWQRAMASNELARATIALSAAIGVLSPAWLQLGSYDHRNTAAIDAQRRADATEGAQLDRLIAVIERDGGGRVYAGMPTNWGMGFTVGAVPVFKYLESRDVDEVGYTLRTASLMTDPEYYFDEHDVGDYILFGIRYLILPRGRLAPVPGRQLGCAGPYCLRVLSFGGYVHVGEIVGTISANRTNVAVRSIALLHSRLPQEHRYLVVSFDRQRTSRPALHASYTSVAGRVIVERDDLAQGKVSAKIVMRRPGVVVLSASFDPGWEVTVNHRLEVPAMVAPALIAVRVPTGLDTVIFRYRGYGRYLPLLLLCAASLAVVGLIDLAGVRPDPAWRAGASR